MLSSRGNASNPEKMEKAGALPRKETCLIRPRMLKKNGRRRKNMKSFTVALLTGSCIALCYGAEMSRDFIQQAIQGYYPGKEAQEKWISHSTSRYEAWARKDYSAALREQKAVIENLKTDSDVLLAENAFILGMLYWNVGQTRNAVSALENGIQILRKGTYVGGSGCERRAVVFLRKMRQRQLPNYFSCHDASSGGILGYIMEVPNAVYHKKINQLIQRYEAIGRMNESMANTYRIQGEMQARFARFYAGMEYQKSTGDTFSPSHPPISGTEKREKWDACKRIYDIFGQ